MSFLGLFGATLMVCMITANAYASIMNIKFLDKDQTIPEILKIQQEMVLRDDPKTLSNDPAAV